LVDPDLRTRSQSEIAELLTAKTKAFPEARTFVIQEQTISAGGQAARGGLPVQFVLQAPDFERLKEVLPRFLDEANKNPVFQGVDANLKFNKPEINITINREKAQNLGVAVADIAQTLQLAFSGQRFSYFTMKGKQYQVIGQVDRSNRDEPLDLTSVYVKNNRGELIQIDNLVNVEEQSNPPQLYHYNRYMSATVSAGLAPGKTVGDGIQAMDEIAASVLDDSFSTSLTGASRDFAESSSNILFAFVLALILIYLILAAQFESFIDPLIIMITVPLALAGALFSLWYFNQTMNIFSQIGLIMLIGLVTKNGILIVEFANQLREQGLPKSKAILQAAEARLRPILMTTMATVLGALPIALALGAGAESRKSMGIVIIGGLLFSLILTLFVIPAMYQLLSIKKDVQSENISNSEEQKHEYPL
jgi:multidrug efflux pump